MNEKKFRNQMAFLSFFIAIAMGASAATGNWLFGIIALLIGMLSIYQIKTRMKSMVIIEDEMVEKYVNKAARNTIQIFGPTCSVLALIFIALRKSNETFFVIGNTLAFATCGLVLIYVIAYKIITKELRDDKNEK